MGKNVGLTYGEFKFPAEQGFTGSAGVHKVKGYMRGGHVKKMPANVKAKGGYMEGGMHDKLKKEGGKMGYAYGGQVKPSNTSAQFKMKKGKQDTMDHGVQPAQTGINQAEVEAGGNKRLKAGYRKGGVIKGPKKGVHRVRSLISKDMTRKLGALKGSMSDAERRYMSKKGMPKNVKAKGGLAKYAHGGSARKPYTGYNKQAGGSGNEDARYMQRKK